MKRGRHLAYRPVSRGWVLPMALALSLVLGSVAWADQITNTIDSTVDPGLETRTITAGGSTTVGFYVIAETVSGDANGCNATGNEPATATLDTPTGVVASSSAIVFVGCGPSATKTVTFSSSTPGNYTITILSVTGGKTGSKWNTAPAAFTLVVESADSTPPVIAPSVSGTLGKNGWYVSDVTVSWSITDPDSAITTTSGCGPTTINTDTLGQTLTCSATSAGGSNSQSVTIKRDVTAPSVSASALPAPNANGWNNTNVTVSFSGTDSLSGIDSCSADVVLSGEGAGQSATGSCTDKAGNSASATASGISIDKTAPSVSASALPAPNANGWNNTNVTVSFSGTDSLSGIDSCSADVVLSGEGAGQSATGSCTDKAGNSASATASGINIDKTNPTVSLVGGPSDGASYYFGFVPAAPTCSASDALSGIDGSCSVAGYSTTVGSHIVTAAATDLAGNSATASRNYTVLAWTLSGFYSPVQMGSGVLNTVKAGSTVPLKFEVFAGSTELTDVSLVSLGTRQIACPGGTEDPVEVEMLTAGSTSLRYDVESGQFIQNWKTPKLPGKCYEVTMTASDASSIVALFKLK